MPKDADETLGKCSQVAIFVRNDILQSSIDETTEISSSLLEADSEVIFPVEKFDYKLLFRKEFPYDNDKRTTEEKILDDVHYYINRNLDTYLNEDTNISEIPITEIFRCVRDATDIDELRTIIRTKFVINENDCIESAVQYDEISDYGDDEIDSVNKENIDNNRQNDVSSDDNWD